MKLHLADDESPKEVLFLTNPCYRSPEQREKAKSSDWFMTDEELDKLYGKSWQQPIHPQSFSTLAYCGVTLETKPKPAPEVLYEMINYKVAYCLLEHQEDGEEICWDCVAKLDKIRNDEGRCEVMQRLRNPDSCDCALWVLMREGCRCEKEN